MASETQAALLSFIYKHCDSERDEAGYGIYSAADRDVLLTEAYRLSSIYELFKAARPWQLTIELAELAPLRLFIEHYDPEGLYLRFKLINAPLRRSDAYLEDTELLLQEGREFVEGTFKRWSWDHWGGRSLPLDACHAIAREKHLIEHRKKFAMMGLLKASDTAFDDGSPASVEGIESCWKPDVEGSNSPSERNDEVGSDSEKDKASEGSSTAAAAESVASWKPSNSEAGSNSECDRRLENDSSAIAGRYGCYGPELGSLRRCYKAAKDNPDAIIERLDTLSVTASAIQKEVLYIPKVNPEHVVRNIGYFRPFASPIFWKDTTTGMEMGHLEDFLKSASYAVLVHGEEMVSSCLHWCFRGVAEQRWAQLDAERKLEMRKGGIDEWRRLLKEMLPNVD